jgi:hypothetical protein
MGPEFPIEGGRNTVQRDGAKKTINDQHNSTKVQNRKYDENVCMTHGVKDNSS